jgi:hypothetical protein
MRASVGSQRKIGHTTLEIVQFGQYISCLKLYEGEHSEGNKNVTYNT